MIQLTTIHRPDLMPDRVEGSIVPVVQYEMNSEPIALPEFAAPGLEMAGDESIQGRIVSASCLPPTAKQRKFSRSRLATGRWSPSLPK